MHQQQLVIHRNQLMKRMLPAKADSSDSNHCPQLQAGLSSQTT
jgi:hypothetical protein